MRGISVFPVVLILVLGVALASPSVTPAQGRVPATPEALLEAWIELWGTYDLDRVGDLFVRDDRLTYFSSETEGLLRGYDRIVEHHRGFGFTPGGSARDRLIWLDEVHIVPFGDSALIGAIWFFGDPDAPAQAQRGPMSVVAVRSDDGYRIGHMHFATYLEPARERP